MLADFEGGKARIPLLGRKNGSVSISETPMTKRILSHNLYSFKEKKMFFGCWSNFEELCNLDSCLGYSFKFQSLWTVDNLFAGNHESTVFIKC